MKNNCYIQELIHACLVLSCIHHFLRIVLFTFIYRWLYYSTYDVINRSIKRVRLDGTEKQTMFNVHPEHVTGLSIGMVFYDLHYDYN